MAGIGDVIKIKLLSSSVLGETVVSNIEINGLSEAFTVTAKPNDYGFLENKTYTVTADTVYWYYLTMPSAGNLDIDTAYATEVTVYDESLNVISNASSSDKTVALTAGVFIVKVSSGYNAEPVTFLLL